LSWIRHLPSIIASSLLFGFIGTPILTVLLLVAMNMESARPGSMFSGIDEFVLLAIFSFVAVFVAPPAFVIGAVAGIVRIYVRSILVFACVMGALAGMIALCVTVAVPSDMVSGRSVIAGASATVFGCSMLMWRNRPWSISPR
jgi:hypothetical protein